ncbi:MAG TPA: hypothetical protein VGX25_19855 [Actinophytocola sp.]|uniref:hypothetical protein n=1 Tax=Actinophytocola sp. TaxID=1872138 RepID=UPI002DDD02EE|nr:hypothetical protein [Actinophytocola sp.]HEV2781645.1 hypothetical protein [Actinophytocola sp.]
MPAVAAALALAVLAPVLGRGFVLTYDMVFVPRQSLLPDALGLGSLLPRAVPSDAVVALATGLLPGDVLQKLLLAAALFAGALGAGRLVPTGSLATRVVAATAYGWTAYVAERLFIGHWQVLLAYACLPWITRAGLDLRHGKPKAGARLIIACAPAVLTPMAGVLAAGTAVVSAGKRGIRLSVGVSLVLNAPWLVPGLLGPAATPSTPDGVTAFAARAESWGTPVLSLLGLGGIWNADTVPASRDNPLVPVMTVAVVAMALLGIRVLASRWGVAPARAVLLLGAFGVTLAALPTFPVGAAVLRWLMANGPGAGLLRDSQRWVAWWALPLALGFALAVERAAHVLRTAAARRALLAAAAALPIVIMPDLAWAGWGRLAAVDYPDDWARVRAVLAADPRPGDVLAVPLSTFRRFDWNDRRVQLDPARRALPRPTVIDDTLVVDGRPLPGDDRRAAAARQALTGGGDLTRLGFGWLLVEHGTPGRVDDRVLATLERTYRGPWLSLYRLPGEVTPYPDAGPPRVPVLAADLAALAVVVLALLWWGLPAGKLARINRNPTRE